MLVGNVLPVIERMKVREDYVTWKFAVHAYYEHEGLWKSVIGDD